MNALQSNSPLIVYVDIKSPYAFVAIRQTLELEASLGLRFDWRPVTLDIPSYLGSARKSAGKVVESNRSASQWSSVKYAYRDARRYAERQGYKLYGTEKIWDSSLANIAIMWITSRARDRLAEYFEVVYPKFWIRSLDIEDPKVITQCLADAGAPTDGFRDFLAGDGRRQHDELQSQLHPAGIYGVPTYVIDDKVFFGREHLPWIAWCLRGKHGSAPDIAYAL